MLLAVQNLFKWGGMIREDPEKQVALKIAQKSCFQIESELGPDCSARFLDSNDANETQI